MEEGGNDAGVADTLTLGAPCRVSREVVQQQRKPSSSNPAPTGVGTSTVTGTPSFLGAVVGGHPYRISGYRAGGTSCKQGTGLSAVHRQRQYPWLPSACLPPADFVLAHSDY